jgi:hypothetical protein
VTERFETSAMKLLVERNAQSPTAALISKIVMTSVEQAFINNGFELAAFLKFGGTQSSCPPLSDDVDFAIQQHPVKSADVPLVKEVALILLRRAFYESNHEQREFFGKLSRTYALLFSLQADVRTVEYFQHMSSEFVSSSGRAVSTKAGSNDVQSLGHTQGRWCDSLSMRTSAGGDS